MHYVCLHGPGVSKKCGVSWELAISQRARGLFFPFFLLFLFIFLFYLFSLLRLIFTSFYIYKGEPEVIAHDLLSDFTTHASIRPSKPVSVRWYH